MAVAVTDVGLGNSTTRDSRRDARVSERSALVKPWWLLPPGEVHPVWWIGALALLLWLDFATGPGTPFPVLYMIPAGLAAWYSRRWPALVLAITVPIVHITLLAVWWQPADWLSAAAATAARGAVVTLIALWLARLSAHERELIRHAQTLEGLLHICSFCKSFRNDAGEWERLEKFIAMRSETQFSHGLCPECQKTYYPE
jgi:hypothetical protein